MIIISTCHKWIFIASKVHFKIILINKSMINSLIKLINKFQLFCLKLGILRKNKQKGLGFYPLPRKKQLHKAPCKNINIKQNQTTLIYFLCFKFNLSCFSPLLSISPATLKNYDRSVILALWVFW